MYNSVHTDFCVLFQTLWNLWPPCSENRAFAAQIVAVPVKVVQIARCAVATNHNNNCSIKTERKSLCLLFFCSLVIDKSFHQLWTLAQHIDPFGLRPFAKEKDKWLQQCVCPRALDQKTGRRLFCKLLWFIGAHLSFVCEQFDDYYYNRHKRPKHYWCS